MVSGRIDEQGKVAPYSRMLDSKGLDAKVIRVESERICRSSKGHNGPVASARFYIITMTMTAAMIATIAMTITGRLLMCRSMANRVPSGNNSMWHFGHSPGIG